MTGMKQGAGENPFADESDSEESVEQSETNDATASPDASEGGDASESRRETQQRSIQIPYKFRRDGVQDGRNRVPLFLQKDTKSAERDALRALEERLDEDVSLTDLREALVKAGLEHLDEVEMHLEEWGYGMTFDE
ncbi:hypothetical protein [Halalkalicoccus salilacus]|uniref:hypothetical protein n=1 Tax=Halalkalicoccus TaxID=332246 RepID=UPI002F969FD3